jgi:hypothetical protein
LANPQIRCNEIWQRAKVLYEQGIRQKVEIEQNIGKMVIIDVEAGDYDVGDEEGIDSAHRLRAKHPNDRFSGCELVLMLPLRLEA